MTNFSISPVGCLRLLIKQRQLIAHMIRREVASRYQGSMLGSLWSFFIPILMLGIYTFVFSAIFKARWGEGGDSKTQFALILFAGLMLFNFFAECVNRAPSMVLGNANYVKKVIFPLEILPIISVGAGLVNLAISLVVWAVFYVCFFGLPPLTAVYFPLIVFPLVLLTLGVSWFLAALGVFLRDVAQLTLVLTTSLMFLTPIFYPTSAVPERFRILIHANPLALVVEQARAATIFGIAPDLAMVALAYGVAAAIAWLGYAFFQKTRGAFADVM